MENPSADIKLNGEMSKAIPLKSGTRKGCPRSPLLFDVISKVLAKSSQARGKKKKEKKKRIQNGKAEVKLSLFADIMVLHIENSKDSTNNLLEITNKVAGYKINIQKAVQFLNLNSELAKN